ncbi:MAG TPA: beta-ketoacyl synthase N-terminal-like domain-containing protein [Acidimicrobiia bacterium]|nr:beta-ketoacyl synthase N-terminal-like domain-containing protein [Acidimicrobiia bacterium]
MPTTIGATGGGPRAQVGICGVGTVTGYGWGRKLLWDGAMSGESAVVPRPGYEEMLGHDVAYAALVADEAPEGTSRFSAAMMSAAEEAIDDALDRGWRPGENVGLIHAVVLGEVDLWRDFWTVNERSLRRRDYLQLMPSTPMSLLMQRHAFHGPTMAMTAMCASGNAAILTAKLWVDAGIASDVIVLATDISCLPENMKHFVDLGVAACDAPALDVCRPFQEGSRGFPGGEASVGFVVSARSGSPYVRVAGGSMNHDAHHVVSINPDHTQVRRCFERALEDADISPRDVVYLNAHGPGTAQCDAAEAEMLDSILTDAVGVYSIKPLTGHCQGAASAVELAVTCLAYETGVIPAPPQVAPGHPRLLAGPTLRQPGITMKSSIGMGGHNSAILLTEP